ncbi:MAG TPA: pyridoxamine 5'-phosphate oxidase family protein [Candidatus Sulfotelmatobacter sp.]|nr:pyridoxamine 5'-phosphate oxidase family protein [Candidatus Sulfotelmatobacter sp.]
MTGLVAMLIKELTDTECREFLAKATIARLGCSLEDQPYGVPICIAYERECIYFFSTLGKKIKWMRGNPKVCVEVEELKGRSDWVSVIANGQYQELAEPRYTDERNHARKLLQKHHDWWLNPLAERRTQVSDQQITPIFFRVKVDSVTGLRGISEE